MTPSQFVDRWRPSGASERSNYQLFLPELCDLLDIDHPDPAGPDTKLNDYVFERRVDYPNQAKRDHGFIDLDKPPPLINECVRNLTGQALTSDLRPFQLFRFKK